MSSAIYPGSFDPVTKGHLDIIKRAAKMFDALTVSVLNNSEKSPLFSVDERVNILNEVLSGIPNVTVKSYGGLLVDLAMEEEAGVIVRGLRAVTDFDYELQLAQTNRVLHKEIDTVFLATSLRYAYLSSSTVREVASYGGDISKFVPPSVAEQTYKTYGQRS